MCLAREVMQLPELQVIGKACKPWQSLGIGKKVTKGRAVLLPTPSLGWEAMGILLLDSEGLGYYSGIMASHSQC